MQHLSLTLFTALDEDLHRFSLWGQFREIREILKTLEMVVHLLLAFVTALEQNVHFFSLWEPFSSMLLYHRASSTIGIFRWLYWWLSVLRQALYISWVW